MYQNELETTEKYRALKAEIKSMEAAIEKFLTNIFECTAFTAERDFHIMTH
ncbi:MAG: hypothetical protein LBK53_02005 [Heliobacteriaceae bacterium]|jgi:hypothetical protein|nr:hypothetical protein [Heliobacteriaceae bacterium]